MSKILFPTTTFYPVKIGGPNFTLFWHCRELVKNNIGVEIISTDSGFDTLKGQHPPVNSSESTAMGNISYVSGRFKLLRQICQFYSSLNKVDVIHLNSFFSPISLACFLLIILFNRNKKIVWSTRGELNAQALRYSTIKKKVIISGMKYLVSKVTFHSTSSQETADIQKCLKTKSIFQIENLMDLEEKRETIREKRLLYIGRIHPIKNIESLIEGVGNSFSFRNTNYTLLIVGDCEGRHKGYLESLKKLVIGKGLEEKVKFTGHKEGLEKQDIYASSRFTFLPSHSENFGNVVIESMAQGTPVVASKGTPWKILRLSKAGFHVENDPKTLANTVDRIIGMDEDEYNVYSRNCYSCVSEKFDIRYRIDEWIDIYRNHR
ncbi:glycosyltransferase family 4 protein [Akkermansiaceae bacterium]|nr:glycosyltransferase family 4 protein [Akkermansiaceae bacterium]